MVVEKGFNINMAANGNTNSVLCSNNWVKKRHATEMLGAIFCIPDGVVAGVCEKCSFVHKWLLLCEKVVET